MLPQICILVLMVQSIISGSNAQLSPLISEYKNYIQWEKGNVNIMIGVPHDGTLKPTQIPTRLTDESGNLDRDVNTKVFAQSFAQQLRKLFLDKTGLDKKPFMLYNNLHREKMDPNRNNIECCAVSSEDDSLRAYSDYHSVIQKNFINDFVLNGAQKYQQALFFEIHGQVHKEDWIELGYTISKSTLNQTILQNTLRTSIQTLFKLNSFTMDELIRGDRASLGNFVQKANLRVIPSPANLCPFGGNYYAGGYTVATHGTSDNRLNAIQVELPSSLRQDETAAIAGTKFANAVFEFYNFHSLSKLI